MRFLMAATLAVTLSFGSAIDVKAQAAFGVAAGLNWQGLGDVDFESVTAAYESQQGWHLGVFADLKVLVIGIKPGLYYVNAGPLLSGSIEGTPSPQDTVGTFDLTYVSIPIDVKFGLPLVIAEPYLFLGPEFKFNTVSEDEGGVASQLESTVVAGNLGVGVRVNLGNIALWPELRYAFDISSIFGDTITIGGEEIAVDSHNASGVVARLGVSF